MTFTRLKDNKYCERSECGQYTVCAIGGADGFRFEGWFGKQQLEPVNLATAEEAREVCRQHKAMQVKAA